MNDNKLLDLSTVPGETLGSGYPDWPDECVTFEERRAYQRGVAHARALANSVPAAVPGGWQLVPIEPTPEMVKAGNDAAHEGGCDLWQLTREVMNAWPAMLAAAPQPAPAAVPDWCWKQAVMEIDDYGIGKMLKGLLSERATMLAAAPNKEEQK